MPRQGKSVRFAVCEQYVALVCSDIPLVADEALRLVPLIFYDADERHEYSGFCEYSRRCPHLSLPTVDDEHSRQGPLRMREPSLKHFRERRSVVVGRAADFEFAV